LGYFERVGASAFRATPHVGGAWNLDEQHIAPALGLLVHVVESDRDARRDDGLVVGRLSYDILGTVPVDVVDTDVTVLRPGRTIELVEASLSHAGRSAVRLRAWLMKPHDSSAVETSALAHIDARESMPWFDPTSVWPGGFIASLEVRRRQRQPGRAASWVRTSVPLVRDEAVSGFASAAGLLDVANGLTVPVNPREVAFPNIDLTAHFFRTPHDEWLGFDTTVSFGPGGVGLTHSVVHDLSGPVGVVSQCLTVRPLP
jgi:hypothetical protein